MALNIYSTSSGGVANLVSSSPELLTRPASKPDDRSNSSTGELRTGSANQLPSPRGRGLGEGVLLFDLRNSRFDIHQTLDFPTRNQFPKLNVASRSACSAYPFEKIPNPIQPLLPCAETIAEILLRPRFAIAKVSLGELIRGGLGKPIAETSQQTLRHFSLVPTTYINFDGKNALKLKLLRLLRLAPKLDSLFVRGASTFRSADSPVRPLWRAATVPFAYSVVQRIVHLSPDFPTQNAFLKLNLAAIFSLQPSEFPASAKPRQVAQAWASPARTLPVKGQPGSGLRASSTQPSTLNPEIPQPIRARSACSAYPVELDRTCLISSPGGEDQDEGVRSFDSRQTLDFPTQNAFLKLNLAAIFSLQPSAFALHLSSLLSPRRQVATSLLFLISRRLPCRPGTCRRRILRWDSRNGVRRGVRRRFW
jgi:hypothetical protein